MTRRPTRIAFIAAPALLWAASVQAQERGAGPAAAKPAVAKPVAAEPVPPRVDATFRLWDQDRNGVLSLQEFRAGSASLRREGVRQSRQRAQFDKVDANNNGAIDASEYQGMLLVERAGKTAPALSAFDANRNARLEFVEYQDLVRRLAPQRARRQPAATTTGTPASKGNTK